MTSPSIESESGRAWLVRVARPELEGAGFWNEVVAIGWGALPDLSYVQSQSDLRALYEQSYPDEPDADVINDAVEQLHAFTRDLGEGDLVVVPLASAPGFAAVGRVDGSYAYLQDPPYGEDVHHSRRVVWLAQRVPYETFDADLQEALAEAGSVRELRQPDAYARLARPYG